MIGKKRGDLPVIFASREMVWMVSASDISRILDAMREPLESFIPAEERPNRNPLIPNEKEDALVKHL